MKLNIQKVLGRVLPVLLTVTITVTAVFCGTVTASADEYDSNSGWLDVLDYGTLLDGTGVDDGTFFPLAGYQPFGVELPVETTLYSVDMVLSMDGNIDLSKFNIEIEWNPSGAYTSLAVIHLGENLYRAYGKVPSGNYRDFDIRFWNYDGQTYYIDIKSLQVQTVETTSFLDIGYMELAAPGCGIYSGNMVDINSPYCIGFTFPVSVDFSCEVWTKAWKKYDYIDFYVTANVDSINSIFCTDGVNFYPCEINYFDGDNDSWSSAIIRIDLTGVDRASINSPPTVIFRGQGSDYFSMTLHHVTGHVLVDAPDQQVYWWTKLFNNIGSWFTNLGQWLSDGFQSVVNALDVLVNGTQEQQEMADNIQNSVDDYNNQMEQIEKPVVPEGQFDPSTIMGGGSLDQASNLYSSFANHKVPSSMISVVVVFMLGGYVLYGKRV